MYSGETSKRPSNKGPRYIQPIIWGAAAGAFVGFLFAATIMRSYVPRVEVVSSADVLVAMRNGQGLSGTFIWGSGQLGSQVTYNFYRRNEDGSLTPGQVGADSLVRIIEDKNLKDVGYWRTTFSQFVLSSPQASWAIDLVGRPDSSIIVKQEFRVPAGTVVQSFGVN